MTGKKPVIEKKVKKPLDKSCVKVSTKQKKAATLAVTFWLNTNSKPFSKASLKEQLYAIRHLVRTVASNASKSKKHPKWKSEK